MLEDENEHKAASTKQDIIIEKRTVIKNRLENSRT